MKSLYKMSKVVLLMVLLFYTNRKVRLMVVCVVDVAWTEINYY